MCTESDRCQNTVISCRYGSEMWPSVQLKTDVKTVSPYTESEVLHLDTDGNWNSITYTDCETLTSVQIGTARKTVLPYSYIYIKKLIIWIMKNYK